MSVDAPLERVDPRPEDVAARERIRHDLGSTIFVQAAAGSGKTSALVARVTCLVDHGLAELREIAAISFTEAAAAELRGRVASSLCEPPPLESPPEAAARRVAARLQIDESAITTIHGFAQRILSEHPLEADLPLRFEVADERTASIAREERFEAFVDRLYDDPGSADLMRAATVLGIGVEPLRALASQMSERFDGLDLPPEPTLTIPDLVAALAERVRAAALECLPHAGLCTNEEDLLLRRIVRLADALGAVDVDGGWLDLLGWITGLAAEKRARVGRRGSWRGSGIEPVRDAIVAYEGARVAALASIHDAVLRGIGRRMLVEAQSFAEARRHAGDLFFHDLLVIARDLLSSHPEVRTELRERYRYVLVDEFQDTDPLQFEILSLLGTAPGGTALEAGRLFFVGDPMQSIYRFRGADVALYRGVRSEVGHGAVVNLSTNFRSVPAICHFVSSTFAHFVEGRDAESTHLRPFRTEADGPRIWSIGGSDGALRAAQRRSAEAEGIVGAISALVASGAPVTVDGIVRPVRLGDVALLVPVRTGLGELLRTFDRAGIDVRLAESSLIYASEEVEEVIAVLRAIDDRGDDRDVVAALRTSLYSVSDADLRRHVEVGGSWDLGVERDRSRPGEIGVLAAMASLRELRDERFALGPVGTLLELLSRRHVRAIAASSPRGADALRRLDFLLERARACRDEGGRTLRDLLRFFAIERKVGVRVVTRLTDDERDDAVRILTVHGAKGLEFPVVVLAELGGAIGRKPRPPALLVEDRRVEISLGGARSTAGYEELAEAEATSARAESIRLAYVAVTRAREYLIVSLHHRARKEEGSLAALLSSVLDLPPAPQSHGLLAQAPRSGDRPQIDGRAFAAISAAWEHTTARATRPRSISPSALAPEMAVRGGRRRPPGVADRAEDEGVGWRRARASSGIGRAVHAVLQRIDLAAPDGLDDLAREFATREGCLDFVDDVASLVLAATSAPIVRAAAASGSLYRELPLTLSTPGGFVEGVVDLCFEGPDGLVIVDYKTDVVVDETDARQRADRYRLQAGAYAWAVGSITDRRVARVVFLFLAPPDGSIECAIEEVEAVIAEAKAAVAVAVSRDGTPLDHDRGP